MEYEDVLNARNVPDWTDLVDAFSRMQSDIAEHLKSTDKLPSPPMPDLNDLTWSNTYQALRAQKAIKARLLQDMQMVESKISFLQMSCNKLALRRGFRLLPDEILARILEEGYTSDLDGNQFAVTISHVNRRFRHIALESPRLWSTISNYQGIPELKEFLARSKQAGISIIILEKDRPAITPASIFIPLITQQSDRWINFVHEFDPYIVEGASELLGFVSYLPILRRLIGLSEYLSTTLLLNWSMPNLVNYEANSIPDFSATTLVSCTLNLWDGLDGIVSFISNNPTLQSLSLTFHEIITYADRSQVGAKATLSSLETFSVQISVVAFDDDFRRFIANLNLPNITQLSLRLLHDPTYEIPEQSDTFKLFETFFPILNPYPTLNKLDLIIDPLYVVPGKELVDILDRLPSLRHLYVEAPGMNPSFDKWTWRSVPPLHSVELSRCDRITGGFVESFVNELVRNDHSAEDKMRTFTVANCRG